MLHMANAAMLIVAYFAALLLNFGDFSRFSVDEKTMKVGNFLGLPVNFIVFALIVVIVTAGTVQVFGEAILDPVAIVERINNPWIVAVGSIYHSSFATHGHQHRGELRFAGL